MHRQERERDVLRQHDSSNVWAGDVDMSLFFFFKQNTADEMLRSLVGSEMCIRDRGLARHKTVQAKAAGIGIEILPTALPGAGARFFNDVGINHAPVPVHGGQAGIKGAVALVVIGLSLIHI